MLLASSLKLSVLNGIKNGAKKEISKDCDAFIFEHKIQFKSTKQTTFKSLFFLVWFTHKKYRTQFYSRQKTQVLNTHENQCLFKNFERATKEWNITK